MDPISAGDRLRKLLPTLNLVTSQKRTKDLTAATASMLSSMTNSTISMASQATNLASHASIVLKDQTISAVNKVTSDLSSLVVNSGQIVTIDSFREYLSAVDPIYDEFLNKQPVLKAPSKASIPGQYFNSDYPQSGLLQHEILRQPLRRTVTYSDKILEELTICSDTVEALLLNHLEHFDQLLQGLESLNLLEQGLYSAISKIQQTRTKTAHILQSSSQLKLYALARRKARIQKALLYADVIEALLKQEVLVKQLVKDKKYLNAVDVLTAVDTQVHSLPALPGLTEFATNLAEHWEQLDRFLENELVEGVGVFVVPPDVVPLPMSVASDGASVGATSPGLNDHIKNILAVLGHRNALPEIFSTSLKEIILRRAKTRLRKAVSLAASGKTDVSDDEVQRLLAEMSPGKFAEFVVTVHDLALKEVLTRLTVLVEAVSGVNEGGALFRIVLETTAVIDGRLAGLVSGVKLSQEELSSLGISLESRVNNVFNMTTSISKSLKQALPPMVADNVTTELQKKARMLFDEEIAAALSEVHTLLSQEKWEPFRGGVPADIRDFLRLVSSQETEGDEDARKTVKIGRFVFVPVPSLFAIIRLVKEGYEFWRRFRMIGPDVLVRIDGVVAKINEDIGDLVLKGGAVSGGIRQSITATNLAMAAQCCGALAALLPLVSNAVMKEAAENPGFFGKVAGQAKLEAALEDLKFGTVEELNAHKNDVLSKIASILVERFEQLNCLVLTGDENTAKLSKDFNAMYKVLLKCQSPAETKNIFKSAFGVISGKFAEKLKSACRTRDITKLADINAKVSTDVWAFYVALSSGDSAIAGVTDVLDGAVKRMLETLDALLPEEHPKRAELRSRLNLNH